MARGEFSVRSPKKLKKQHHSDSDFNEIRYIGLFFPKNKLVKVKKLYSQNFSKYDPLKSDGGISRLAITWLRIIENIHMHSDFSLEKDALSCGNGNFPFQMNKKKIKLKKPPHPPLDTIFKFFYIFPRQFYIFLKLLINKINGTATQSVLKNKFSF